MKEFHAENANVSLVSHHDSAALLPPETGHRHVIRHETRAEYAIHRLNLNTLLGYLELHRQTLDDIRGTHEEARRSRVGKDVHLLAGDLARM